MKEKQKKPNLKTIKLKIDDKSRDTSVFLKKHPYIISEQYIIKFRRTDFMKIYEIFSIV